MKIGVSKNRNIYKSSDDAGTENENYFEVLEFTFPEELDGYVKYIEIKAENEEGKLEYVDRIEDNKFALSNSLTKYDNLQMQVVCKKYVENKAVTVFKSNIFNVAVDSSLNIMEDVEEEQKSLLDRIEAELQEVYQGMEEFKTEIVEDANSRFNTNVREKTEAFDTNAESKTNAFNSNYDEKLGTFNTNATSKLEQYNNNDTAKTGAYNSNAESKLNAYNTNATEKMSAYNELVTELHEDLDETQAKVEQYNTNIDTKYTQYNTNAEQKMSAYNQNATTKTSEYNANAQTKFDTYNTNATEKMTAYNENAEEKVQEYNDNASALMQSVDDLEAKHDTEVVELNEKIADLQEQVDMASDLIPTDTPEPSSNITINDSARYTFKEFEVGGNMEQETTRGVQLLDIDVALSRVKNGYIAANGTIGDNGPTNKLTYIEIEPNTTYTVSRLEEFIPATGGGFGIASCEDIPETGTTLSTQLVNARATSLTITTTAEDKYLVIYEKESNNKTIEQRLDIIQVEKGSTATEYERYTGGQAAPNLDYKYPISNVSGNVEVKVANGTDITATGYEEQTVTLQLPEGMEMCKIGDYADKFVKQDGKWYKYKIIAKSNLDRTYSVNSKRNDTILFLDSSLTDKRFSPFLSDYFTNVGFANINKDEEFISDGAGYNNRLYLSINKNRLDGYSEDLTNTQIINLLTNYLQGIGAILYYVLKTPVLEEITDTTLIQQLDSLAALYSYKGRTLISSDNTPGLIFKVTYRKDYTGITDARLEALEQAIVALGGV